MKVSEPDMYTQPFGWLHVLEVWETKTYTTGSYKKYLCVCVCGRFAFVSRGHLTSGATTSCGVCTSQQSRAEEELFDRLKALFPDLEARRKGLLPNKRLELDIFCPSTRRAIEYQGEYWHRRPEAVEKDLRKLELCREVGIDLLYVWEASYGFDPDFEFQRAADFLRLDCGPRFVGG